MNSILFCFSSLKRDYDRRIKLIIEYVDELISSKIAESDRIGSSAQINSEEENIYKTPTTVLEILLQNAHKMSYKQIRDEILTILIGKCYHDIVICY